MIFNGNVQRYTTRILNCVNEKLKKNIMKNKYNEISFKWFHLCLHAQY